MLYKHWSTIRSADLTDALTNYGRLFNEICCIRDFRGQDDQDDQDDEDDDYKYRKPGWTIYI